jgi:hypothetical protein
MLASLTEKAVKLIEVALRVSWLCLDNEKCAVLERHDIGNELLQAVAAGGGAQVPRNNGINHMQDVKRVVATSRPLTGDERPIMYSEILSHLPVYERLCESGH